jgi:hypothetical protein
VSTRPPAPAVEPLQYTTNSMDDVIGGVQTSAANNIIAKLLAERKVIRRVRRTSAELAASAPKSSDLGAGASSAASSQVQVKRRVRRTRAELRAAADAALVSTKMTAAAAAASGAARVSTMDQRTRVRRTRQQIIDDERRSQRNETTS